MASLSMGFGGVLSIIVMLIGKLFNLLNDYLLASTNIYT